MKCRSVLGIFFKRERKDERKEMRMKMKVDVGERERESLPRLTYSKHVDAACVHHLGHLESFLVRA